MSGEVRVVIEGRSETEERFEGTANGSDKRMSDNIAGKVVVITGASSGLGEATARHLSACGAVVALGATCAAD